MPFDKAKNAESPTRNSYDANCDKAKERVHQYYKVKLSKMLIGSVKEAYKK